MRNHVENQVLPADWSQVIEQVQDVLTETERAANERGHLLVEKQPAPRKKNEPSWEPTLDHFEERLRQFRAALQKAEDDAEEADLALADGDRALQQWLDRSRRSSPKTDTTVNADR